MWWIILPVIGVVLLLFILVALAVWVVSKLKDKPSYDAKPIIANLFRTLYCGILDSQDIHSNQGPAWRYYDIQACRDNWEAPNRECSCNEHGG
jgi:hypothetical protein